jgi:hypothetical protein
MSRNGAGVYSLASGNPVVTGTTISSTWANTTLSDLATAMTASIANDGQTPILANLPMSGFKHTGVAVASALTDYARYDQVQNSTPQTLSSVSGADTITATATPTPSAYAAGQTFRFVSAGANTGAATLNVSSLGAKAITKNGSTALAAGDIPNGAVIEVTYDGTRFQLMRTSIAGLAASGANSDITSLASPAIGAATATTQAGTDNSTKVATTAQVVAAMANSPAVYVVSASGAIGYGTGAGATATQSTSKSTAVTLNRPTGRITMNSAALASGATVKFSLNNSLLAATDTLNMNIASVTVADIAAYNLWWSVADGVATVVLKNVSAGSLSEAVVIGFTLQKGATS